MVGKTGRRGIYFFAIFLLAFSILPFVSAQAEEDSDGDGVFDQSDACSQTNYEEGLPIIVQHREFLGCSCSQIYEKLGEYCYDVFCSTGRPFSMKARTYSSRFTSCEEDYCREETLYDFPSNTRVECVDGKEKSFSCDPIIIKNSELCINSSVPQYNAKEEKEEVLSDVVLLDNYEKLQKRAYALSQNTEIKIGLGISGEELFLQESEETMDSVIIEKTIKTESRTIADEEKIISIKTIKITPNKHKTLNEVYIFEELPRGAKIELREVIPGTEVVMQEEGPVILVWNIEKISEPVELTYQINKRFEGESNTLLVAKEIRSGFWKMMILPIIVIGIAVYFFIRTSEKSIPKRKKIFKD